jgi:hypothetical protein
MIMLRVVAILAVFAAFMAQLEVPSANASSRTTHVTVASQDQDGSFLEEVIGFCHSGKKRCNPKYFTDQGSTIIYNNYDGHCAKFRVPYGGITAYGELNTGEPKYYPGDTRYRTGCYRYVEFSRLQEQLPGRYLK